MNDIQFTYIVKKYSKLIFTVCYRLLNDYQEAENIAQETFLAAFKNIDKFEGDEHKAWLVKIASNKCKDYLKSAYKRTTAPTVDDELVLIQDNTNQFSSIEENESVELIYSQCKELKEPYREVAILHYVEEKSFDEIALELNRPMKTVQTQVYRARDKLRKKVKEVIFNA